MALKFQCARAEPEKVLGAQLAQVKKRHKLAQVGPLVALLEVAAQTKARPV